MNPSTQRPIRDFELERYRLGELPKSRMLELQAMLETDAAARAKLEALESADLDLTSSLPPKDVAREIRRRLAIEAQLARLPDPEPEREEEALSSLWQRFWRPGLATAGMACAAALAMWFVTPAPPAEELASLQVGVASQEDSSLDVTRIKGLKPHLRIYKLDGEKITRLVEPATVTPGTLLQVGYVAPGMAYGMVLSIDGAGQVSLHQPEASGMVPRIDPSGEHRLAHSWELDSAPGFERFFLVTAAQPFQVEDVLSAAKTLAKNPEAARTAALPLSDSLQQTSFMLEK